MRGQVTLFIVLGIVLMSTFFLVFYIANLNDEPQADVGQTTMDTNVVKYYIQSCIEQSTKEGLLLVALQGGYIYDYQLIGGYPYRGPPYSRYGERVVPFWHDGKVYNVTYAIMPRNQTNTILNYPPPSTAYSDITGKPLTHGDPNEYPFGDSYLSGLSFTSLPSLCISNGSNREEFVGARFSCETYSQYLSTQKFLQDYILNKTLECIDLEGYKPENIASIIPMNQSPEVEVVFGEDSVFAFLDMPIKIELPYDAERTMDSFMVQVPIRFKKINELAFRLLEADSKDIFNSLYKENKLMKCKDFSSVTDSRDKIVDCFRDGMSIRFIKNACVYTSEMSGKNYSCNHDANYSSFVVIYDNKSLAIDNKPFPFVFLIGNRGPVIDDIDFKYFDSKDEYTDYLNRTYYVIPGDNVPWTIYNRTRTPVDPESDADIVIDYGKTLYILPRGIDPDEDGDVYNASLILGEYIYKGWRANDLLSSDAYLRGLPGKEPIERWVNMIKKDVKLQLTKDDVGTHIVNVGVYDEAGNYFEQEVKIQVRCYDKDHSNPLDIIVGGIKGDYDFSKPNDPDINDANDCCNESGGYEFSNDWHKCGNCMRCQNGDCKISLNPMTSKEDCPICRQCAVTGDCAPQLDNSPNADCEAIYTGNGICCGGNCLNKSDPTLITEFNWTFNIDVYGGKNGTKMNMTYPDCWESSPSCITKSDVTPYYLVMVGTYSFAPITNPTPGSCGGTGRCDHGLCIP